MQALGQSFQSASPIRFPARLENYLTTVVHTTSSEWKPLLDGSPIWIFQRRRFRIPRISVLASDPIRCQTDNARHPTESAKGRLGVPISWLLWHVCCAQLHSAAQHFWQNYYMDIGTHGSARGGSVLAEDFVAYLPYSRYPIRGRGKYEDWTKQFRSGFSNFQCDIDELIDDGMRAAVRWTWSGTHTGNLLGIAPTNRKIEFTETHLLRISGGRIAEDHVSANLLDLLDQLGTTQFAAA